MDASFRCTIQRRSIDSRATAAPFLRSKRSSTRGQFRSCVRLNHVNRFVKTHVESLRKSMKRITGRRDDNTKVIKKEKKKKHVNFY